MSSEPLGGRVATTAVWEPIGGRAQLDALLALLFIPMTSDDQVVAA